LSLYKFFQISLKDVGALEVAVSGKMDVTLIRII